MRVILDVDTGVDDALAIALAVRHPSVELEAVTTVAGNVGLELTTPNTLRVLDWLGAADIPVHSGADRPLSGVRREATRWHGADGLGGAKIPASTRAATPDAVEFLGRAVLANPAEVTLVCTGPLTNLALAVQHEPRMVECVKEVVLMGGTARPPGNVTTLAEFNIYADPDAAAVVFEQAWKVTMVGLNVTDRVKLTRADRDNLLANSSREAELVREISYHLFDANGYDAMSLHDPLALAVAIQPDLVVVEHRDVEVETRGEHTLGQIVIDYRRTAPAPTRNTHVATDVDVDRARALILGALQP